MVEPYMRAIHTALHRRLSGSASVRACRGDSMAGPIGQHFQLRDRNCSRPQMPIPCFSGTLTARPYSSPYKLMLGDSEKLGWSLGSPRCLKANENYYLVITRPAAIFTFSFSSLRWLILAWRVVVEDGPDE
jgi:hypothetical protein